VTVRKKWNLAGAHLRDVFGPLLGPKGQGLMPMRRSQGKLAFSGYRFFLAI